MDEDGTVTSELPIDLDRHEIELEAHDVLGDGDEACLACHDDPAADPGKLLLPDGSLVDVTGDTSRVCMRCHFAEYEEFQLGFHGNDAPTCTSAGCHDPHTPSWIHVPALPPFQATGIEVEAVGEGEGEPFSPLAGPPVDPAVATPVWLRVVAAVGGIAMLGGLGSITVGRSRR